MKKRISGCLACLLLLGATSCAAGSSSDQGAAGPAVTQNDIAAADVEWDYQLDTSPYEFTIWWPAVWAWAKPSVENGWPDDGVTGAITEATGVKVNIEMPSGLEKEIAGPLIASGQYPDVMIFESHNSPYVGQMQEAGALYAISDLMDEYAPKMYEVITSTLMQLHADEDGKLWKYVGFEYEPQSVGVALEVGISPTSGGNIMFARRDVLEAFGKEDIRTLDELTELLIFARQNFPDLDPIKLDDDIISSKMCAKHMSAIFGLHLSQTYPHDGEIEYAFRDPKYLEYVGWLNDLYQKGVITDNMLADGDQAKDEKLFAGRYAVLVDATFNIYNTVNTTIESNTGGTDTTYKAIGPAEKEGVDFQVTSLRSMGSLSTVITQNAGRPDRVIRFLEYLLTDEGQTLMVLGVEGTSWEEKGGQKVLLPDPAELISADIQAYATKYNVLGRWAPFVKTPYWTRYCDNFLTPVGEIRDENNSRLDPYIRDIWEEGFMDIRTSLPVGSDEDVINTRITDIHKTSSAKMISAKSEEELMREYEKLLSEAEKAGAAQVEAAFTATYQENLARLG